MAYGGKSGDWGSRRVSTNSTFAKSAIAVHICRGCGEWHEGPKPRQCRVCGRMDFEDFQSKGEAKWWVKLLRRQETGRIRDLRRQIRIGLLTVHHRTGKPVEWAVYWADFGWTEADSGEKVLAECKPGGDLTYESQLKLRCVEAMGIPITALT